MHTHRRSLAIAGVITAAAIAVPSTAFAAGFSSPSGKTGSPSACAAPAYGGKAGPAPSGTKSPAGPGLTVRGLSASQLQAGLIAAKRAGGDTPAGIAAFAAAAGVSQATAQRVVQQVFGARGGKAAGQPDMAAFAAVLAAKLGVSTSAAQRALDKLAELGRGGIDATSPAFAAIARDLGVTSDQLNAALQAGKQSLAGQQGPGKSGPGKPGSGKSGPGTPGSGTPGSGKQGPGKPGTGKPGSCSPDTGK